ncbi:MAG: metallophosphoesterase [Halioglobus sp.]|nr:metallophosphoesterase [Halioglobus sp.]
MPERIGWRLGLVLMFSGLFGCSDANDSSNEPEQRQGGTVIVLNTNAQPGPDLLARLAGFDQFGEQLYTGDTSPLRQEMVYQRIPTEVVTVRLEYVTVTDELLESFSTSVNLASPVTITDPSMVSASDPVTQAFAYMGCSRVADGGGSQNLPSTANVANMIQDFAEIADPGLQSPIPSHLIVVGDLVVNHVPGTATLSSQLEGWKAVFQTTPLSGSDVQLVTLAGNHEMLQKVNDVETQNPPTGDVFTQAMMDFIPASNGPTQASPNLDGVARDESMLTFSFQFGNAFFIQLNTDTYTGDDTPAGIGFVPLYWLQNQLIKAQDDPTVDHVFVFGHKPIIGEEGVGETIARSQVDEFTKMLCNPRGDDSATKVRGYFAAHAHYWQQRSLDCPASDGTLLQVISGNGGTSVEQTFFRSPNGYFGYTNVGITESGALVLEARGRFITVPDDAPGQAETTVREYRNIHD